MIHSIYIYLIINAILFGGAVQDQIQFGDKPSLKTWLLLPFGLLMLAWTFVEPLLEKSKIYNYIKFYLDLHLTDKYKEMYEDKNIW